MIVKLLKLSHLENVLIVITFFSILFPLQTKVTILNVVLFNIPLYALIFLGSIHRVQTGNFFIGTIDKWSLSGFILLSALLFSSLMSPNFGEIFGQFLQFAHLPFLSIYFRSIYHRKINAYRLILFASIILFIEGSTSIIQQLTNSDFGNIKAYVGEAESKSQHLDLESALSRIQGTLGNPNVVAAWIICSIPFVIISRFYQDFISARWWSFRLFLILISIITIFFTFSRGGLLIFLMLSLLAYPYYLRLKSNIQTDKFKFEKTLRFSIYLLLVVAGILIIMKNLDLINIAIEYAEIRIKDTFAGSSKKVSADYRLMMSEAAIKYISKHPLIGAGFGNGNLIYQQVGFYNSNLLFRPHNTFLLMGAEGGIIAMLSFMYFSIMPLMRIIRHKIKDPIQYALIFSLMACLGFVQIYLITVSSDFAPFFFILLGIAMGYADQQYEARKKSYFR